MGAVDPPIPQGETTTRHPRASDFTLQRSQRVLCVGAYTRSASLETSTSTAPRISRQSRMSRMSKTMCMGLDAVQPAEEPPNRGRGVALNRQISIYSTLRVFWELPPDKEHLIGGFEFIFAAREGGRLLFLWPWLQDHLKPSRFGAEMFGTDGAEFARRDDSHEVACV